LYWGNCFARVNLFFSAPPTTFAIATGLKGGAFDQFANSYREKLARHHVTLNLHPTANASANLKPIEDRSSGVDVAFLFSGATNSTQSPELMSLGRVGYNPIWIFYRGTETLDRLTQLKGKRIGLLLTFRVTTQILAANGVSPDSATMLQRVGPAAAKALKDGEVDAIVTLGELNAPYIQSLLRDPTVRLMNLIQAEGLARVFPYINPLVLPQGVIDFENNIPPSNVNLIAITTVVVVRKSLHPELVYLLAQTQAEEHRAAGIFNRTGEFPTQADPEFPMAEAAVDYYKNGLPFLTKYLPVWMVSHVQRFLALLVGGGAIVFSLFNLAPKLFKSLVEYRLGSMYRRLRELEASLQKDVNASEVSAFEAELASIDRKISILGVPMKHSDMFFSIKSHLDVVRMRLGLRRAELQSQVAKAV
jgi:TRAP-type uncharacterized transport system substrate-binding protein